MKRQTAHSSSRHARTHLARASDYVKLMERDLSALRQENARLKARLAELEQQQKEAA